MGIAGMASVLDLMQGEGNQFERLPRASTLNDLTYRCMVAGFPSLGLGIALGAYRGTFAWGRYRGWDPKETRALITRRILAGYLHAHSLTRWRGQRAAWPAGVGLGTSTPLSLPSPL